MLAIDRLHIEFGSEDQIENRHLDGFGHVERRFFRFRSLSSLSEIVPERRASSRSSLPHIAEKIAEIKLEVLRGLPPSPPASSAELREDILKAAKALRPSSRGAECVVLFALFRIPQHLIGGIDFLEFLFGFLVPLILVGMVLHGKLAVRFLDLVGARGFGYSENGIRVFLGHTGKERIIIKSPIRRRRDIFAFTTRFRILAKYRGILWIFRVKSSFDYWAIPRNVETNDHNRENEAFKIGKKWCTEAYLLE